VADLRAVIEAVRIAIATDWFAPRPGGIETQLVGLADRLGARGHDVDVITSTPNAMDGHGYRVRSIRSPTLPGAGVALTPALLPELRELLDARYDVVHGHVSVVSPVGYGAAAVATSLGLPAVLSFHSVLHSSRFWLGLANRGLGLGDAPVIWAGVSGKVAEQLRRALPGTPVDVLPNGVDLSFWDGTTQVPHAGATRFISAMRLHSKKRPRALLRAFADATGPHGSETLTFVGDGPEEAALRRDVIALGVADAGRVRFVAWSSAQSLRTLYSDSDVFVSACEREAFGIAALEARVAGLPVIAMRKAGSSEFLRHCEDALLCDDDAELVTWMRRVSADTQLRKSLAASRPVVAKYDWPAVVEAHEAAYARAKSRVNAAKARAR
jgi:glycosyltransferase involved in cell wall biosynthesis